MTTDTINYTVTTYDGLGSATTASYSVVWDSNDPWKSHMSLTCYMTVNTTTMTSDYGPADLYMDGNLLPVDEISIEFSNASSSAVTFVIACAVVHKHFEPGNPTSPNAEGSTCTIDNNTISTNKKFEIHVTPTSGTTEATWTVPGVAALLQPKRLVIKVKRAGAK